MPPAKVNSLKGMGVKAAIPTAHPPYLENRISILETLSGAKYLSTKGRPALLPIAYPARAPATEAEVVKSAYQKLNRGFIRAMGNSTRSGGIGKNIDSQNDNKTRPNWPYSNMASKVSAAGT